MGCFRVFARGRVADFHGVEFELDTDTNSLRLERTVSPSMRAYVLAVTSLVRLEPDHPSCDETPAAYMAAVQTLNPPSE